MRNILKIKILTIISITALVLTLANISYSYLFLPGALQKKKIVIIKSNLSIKEISILLEQEQIIKYRLFFEIFAKIYSLKHTLKSGEYDFTAGITPYQVLIKLASGTSIVHRLLITEGQTVGEITALLNSENRLFGRSIANIPEGYLMPSTYFYSYGDQREKIINEMRTKMSRALDEAMLKLDVNSPIKTRKELLTLASIVEKEAGNDFERPLIAAAFLNRLKLNMKLQADPTVIYAITKGEYKLGRNLSRKDLLIDSPYNTYKEKGLPLGPIACPGIASISAVVAPAKTDALYFVSNGGGGHYFANSLDAHNINVKKFKQSILDKNR